MSEVMVSVGRKAPLLENRLAPFGGRMVEMLDLGFRFGVSGRNGRSGPWETMIPHRVAQGFKPRPSRVLTTNNAKLNEAEVRSVGLTLAHADISGFELCPHRGVCTSLCVVALGHGQRPTTQRAWIWRTQFLADKPEEFWYIVGWELGLEARNGDILFRPKVNDDLPWWRLMPTAPLVTPGVTWYGYTKDTARIGVWDRFHESYSWNEKSPFDRVRAAMLDRRGAFAVVTDRAKGEPLDPSVVRRYFDLPDDHPVADADRTDEWMLVGGGMIGELSAKGPKARRLVGKTGFIVGGYR